ncbi:MAG TPA: sensor domain-containing diguanylate cyclase [Nitrospirae bacterium]|nr:sensor domain-containing diguanylate cyclase [Nitrospirota bacterium]
MTNKSSENKGSKEINDVYRDIVVSTNTLIWRTDAEGRFTFLNPAWEKIYNYKIEEMLGKPFSDFQVPEAAGHYINAFRDCLIGESIIGHETAFSSKGGDEIHLAINMIPLHDDKDAIVGIQGTAFDITERKHADDILQYISAKDELTGLYNLHTFLSMTEQQIRTAHREKKDILIIYAGQQNIKKIIEEHGEEAGDRVIIDAANILRKTFREADVLARTGGSEFVISTIVLSKDGEKLIFSRLHKNIDEYNKDKNGSLKLLMSFGTSFYDPEKPVSINDLLSTADDEMYKNKYS